MSNADRLRARASRAANRKPAAEAQEHPQHPDQTSLLEDQPDTAPASARRPRDAGRRSAGPRTKPVRITVDLSPLAYRDLSRWCAESADQLDMVKVNNAAVVRTLLALLDDDPNLSEQVRARLAADPSGSGTQ